MRKLPRIINAQRVIQGAAGESLSTTAMKESSDLQPLIAKGNVFSWLNAPSHFATVRS